MNDLDNFEGEKFLQDLTGFNLFGEAFLEVVTDYRRSRYFAYDQMQDAYDFATEMASQGHDIHFGPAARKNDLGAVSYTHLRAHET